MDRVRPARKVAFVFTSMPVGGAEDFALGVGPHLAPDFEAHYVCLRDRGRLGDEAAADGRPVHVVPVFRSRWITPWAVRRFAAWLQRENIAVVHSQTHHAHVFATKAAKLLGLPSVVHQQKTLEDLPRRRARLFRACLERASHVVALSPRTARDLAKTFSVPAEKISVVANGIERGVFRPPDDRVALRRQLALPDDGPLAVSVGRLHRHKNHETTIEAVAQARRQGVNVTAVLVGEGAQRAELESLARTKGVSDAVLFPGAQRPVVPWMQAADVFVLPSVWEGQPLALLQAAACGVPVLASNIEGNTAVLGHDYPGLFAPGDATWLAKLLTAATRDEAFLPKLRESLQDMDIPWSDASARQLADIYRTLLSSHANTPIDHDTDCNPVGPAGPAGRGVATDIVRAAGPAAPTGKSDVDDKQNKQATAESLHIAILAPTFLPKCSGAEVFHHNLATRLVEVGHRVTVIAPRARVRQLRAENWDLPYAVEAYPDRRWNWLKRHRRFGFWLNRRALDALQRRHRFDVWHAFVLYPAGVVLADWQQHSGVPGLVRAVGDDVSGLPAQRHAAHVEASLREKLPSAGAVVALSREMSDELVALGIAREKIRILPNAVEAARFAASPEKRRVARAGLAIPESAFVFLCVARNHPQKDFPTLLAAFREVRRRNPHREVRLVMAGRDTERLRSQTGDLAGALHLCQFGAESPARGVPPMPPDQLVGLYLAADAFVLSSLLEGFSSALVEAMAAGLPLVVTDAPGIRGVVAHDREALMVPVGSPASLADAMQRVIDDAVLRERLSGAARSTASRYAWPAVVSSYLDLYRELIAARAAR